MICTNDWTKVSGGGEVKGLFPNTYISFPLNSITVTGLQFLNNEGSALYSTQSKINHSCVPNAQATFPHSDHTLALVALSDIAAGDEICISYLDECALERSRHSRQKELKENYLFVCRCGKCEAQSGDADVTSDEDDEDDDDDDAMDD